LVSDQAAALASTFVDEKKRRGTYNQALSLVVVQQGKTSGYSIRLLSSNRMVRISHDTTLDRRRITLKTQRGCPAPMQFISTIYVHALWDEWASVCNIFLKCFEGNKIII
jgi:hypothetical protein